MRWLFSVLNILVFVALAAATGWAHGVEGYVEPSDGYCVTALYDDGEPMSYAAVKITAPDDGRVFQTGRTDRNGCFVFRPDSHGRWQAVVTDGMGHRLALDVTIDNHATMPQTDPTHPRSASNPISRALKIIAGLSIIFGLTGFGFGWKARRKMGTV